MSVWVKEKALAGFFHVSTKTVRRWAQRGMPRVREGSVVLYVVEDCEAWLRSRAEPGPAASGQRVPARRATGRRRRTVV